MGAHTDRVRDLTVPKLETRHPSNAIMLCTRHLVGSMKEWIIQLTLPDIATVLPNKHTKILFESL